MDSKENLRDVLKSRADLIAVNHDDQADDIDLLLVFNVGVEHYAVYYADIIKVVAENNVTQVPFSPDSMAGIFYYEGEVWPILSSITLTASKDDSAMSNILLLNYEKLKFGLIVGEIQGQKSFDRNSDWQKVKDSKKEYIQAIYDHSIAVLCIKALHNIITELKTNKL